MNPRRSRYRSGYHSRGRIHHPRFNDLEMFGWLLLVVGKAIVWGFRKLFVRKPR